MSVSVRASVRDPPHRYDVMEVDTGLDEMGLTFASVEGPRGGGTMEVMRQATQSKDIRTRDRRQELPSLQALPTSRAS
jgi:hypothetical protein